jgi:hypothetical protein
MSTTIFWREKCHFLNSLARRFTNPKNGTAIKTRSTSGAYYGQLDLLAHKKNIDL